MSRREGTRKSGKLIVFQKDKPEQTMPLRNIRASSREEALIAVEQAIKSLSEIKDYKKSIDNETELVVKNNMLNAYITGYMRDNNSFIFDYVAKVEYSLPVEFKPYLQDDTERETNG
jgi:hypothetical protein